jgi:excisionase family DNA binding protein
MSETLLTPAQVAKRVHRSKRTLERWRKEGRGPRFLKFGNRILYSEADVDEWLSKRAMTPAMSAKVIE